MYIDYIIQYYIILHYIILYYIILAINTDGHGTVVAADALKIAIDTHVAGSTTVGVTFAILHFEHRFSKLHGDELRTAAVNLRSQIKGKDGVELPEILHKHLVALCGDRASAAGGQPIVK